MSNLKDQADDLWRLGLTIQQQGDLDSAAELYRESIEIYPTADAHTYLGWVYSLQSKLAEALRECMIAIELDPSFGNPYNDIGCYLMMQKRYDEAMSWLEKAKAAPRYEARCYPYFNLGRIYEMKGLWREAIREYKQALAEAPNYQEAYLGMKRLEAKLN